MSFRYAARWCVLIALPCLLAGCGDPQAKNDFSNVRLVNGLLGVPGGANVDMSVARDSRSASNLPLGGASAYMHGSYGSTTISAFTTGTTTQLVPTTNFDLAQTRNYSIIASGIVGTTGLTAPKFVILTDTIPTPPTGAFQLRLVNLSPDAKVSLQRVVTTTGVVGTTGGIVSGLSNLAYQNISPYAAEIIPTTGSTFVNYQLLDSDTGTPIPTAGLGGPTGGNSFVIGNIFVTGNSYTLYVVGFRNPASGQPALNVHVALDQIPTS